MTTAINCPPCRTLDCAIPDDVDIYTLNNGTLFENPETPVAISVPPGVYIVPRGTIQFVVSSNPISPLRLLGCLCEIVVDIDGMTSDQIAVVAQDMVNAAAVQFGQCRNLNPAPPFFNGVETITCPGGILINLIGNPQLPAGVSLIAGQLVIQPGVVFSTASEADANQKALTLLQNTLANLMAQGKAVCGFWNVEVTFTCPGGSPVIDIPAFMYFSQVSQADADAQALAAAEAQCSDSVCSDFGTIGDNKYGISGYNASMFTNNTGSDCSPPAEWDGIFVFFDDASKTWFASTSAVNVNGQCACPVQLEFDGCVDGHSQWFIHIVGDGEIWQGFKQGGNDPTGVYNQVSGSSPGPASLVVVLVAGTTGAGTQSCGS